MECKWTERGRKGFKFVEMGLMRLDCFQGYGGRPKWAEVGLTRPSGSELVEMAKASKVLEVRGGGDPRSSHKGPKRVKNFQVKLFGPLTTNKILTQNFLFSASMSKMAWE